MEEIDLREYHEERELFMMLDINIPNIKMKSDDWFYIDLYDDDEGMKDLDKDIFYARGLNGQYVICFPQKDLIIVRIGEKRESSGNHPTDLLKYVEWGESL